jgi:hypothetical protein
MKKTFIPVLSGFLNKGRVDNELNDIIKKRGKSTVFFENIITVSSF